MYLLKGEVFWLKFRGYVGICEFDISCEVREMARKVSDTIRPAERNMSGGYG